MASPILDRYREIAPSTQNFSDEGLAEELRQNFYPEADPETFKANIGVTRDITKRPIDRYRAQTPQTWGMSDQELAVELHSQFGEGEPVERYAEQLGVELPAPSRRRPESSAIDSGIGVGGDSAETDSDQSSMSAQDRGLALPSANFNPSPDADLSGGAARRARREARPEPIAEQDEGPSAFAIANEGARQGVAGLYESFYATPRAFRRTVIDPVNEIADRAIESLGGDPETINPRVELDTGPVGAFFESNEQAFREWADQGGNREAAEALAAKAQEANQAFNDALEGDLSGVGQVLSDPSAWAGFIGQAAPSLAVAALSGGSIAVIGWMEALEAAKDAEDFERRTGVKLSPMEFTRAVGQTAAVNSILEKAGVDRVLNPGSGSLVTRALKAGTAEGTTEALQELSSNVAAQTYDPERSTTENVLAGAMGGFGSGALVGSSQTPVPSTRRDDGPPEDISIPEPETGGGPLTQPSIPNQQGSRDFDSEFAAIDEELNRLQREVIAPSRDPDAPSLAPEAVAEAEQRVSALLDQRDRLTDELRQIEQEQRPQLEAPQDTAPNQASELPDLQVATAESQRQINDRREQLQREGVPDDQAIADPILRQLQNENERAAQTLSSLQARADEQQANAAIDRNRAPTDDTLGNQIEQTRAEARDDMREEIQRLRQMTTRPAPLTDQPETALQQQARELRERARVPQTQAPEAQPSLSREPLQAPAPPVNNPATGEFTPERVATDNIEIDPETYQFRENVNRDGVDDRLEGITQFDDLRAGTVIVHQRDDGRTFVADGHHRVDLARRLGRENINAIVLRESDGFSAADARRFAAERNIAENNATALDAAKVFREYGGDPAAVAEQRDLPRRSQVVRDGADIAQLSDEAFGAVLNEQITEKDAAAIGRNFSDPDQQMAAVQQYQRVRPNNDRQREILANEIREAGFSQGEQGGLFGSDPAESLIAERVQVQDAAIRRLSRSGSLFRTLNENAGTAERAGNQIARDQNAAIQQNAALAADLVRRASTTPEINQAINEAAQRVKDGESIRRVAADLEERIINEAQRLGSASPGASPDTGLGSVDQAGQDARGGQSVPSQDAGRDGAGAEQRLPGAESELLTQPTPEDLQARDQAEADRQAAERAADQRAEADAQRDDFTLTGSDTEADQAAARGQDSLLEGSRPEYSVGTQEPRGQDRGRTVGELANDRESQGQLFTLSGEANPVKRAPDSAFNVDGATEVLSAPSGQFGTVTSTKRTVTYSLPDRPIRTAADAATATAQVRKNAQENLLALVTDDNGQVIDLIRHSVGDVNSASANASILAGSILRVPGASNVWLSHNHPGGKSRLSDADRRSFETIRDLMDGSGVQARAIIAVGDSKYSADIAGGESVVEARLRPARRTREIAVSERTLNRRDKLAEQINNPEAAIKAAKDLGGNSPGVALLNNQFQPVAWVPVSIDEMGAMRNTGVLERILQSIERSNANSAIVSVGDSNLKDSGTQRAVANISSFFRDANVRLLDSVSTDPEIAISEDPLLNAEIEASMPTPFFNRAEGEALGLSATEAMGYVDGLMSEWRNAPEVLVAQAESDLPPFLRQRIQDAGAQGEVRGVIWDGRIYVIADNVSSRAEVEETIFHEVVRHYGMRQVLGDNYNDFMDQVYMRVGRSAIEPFAEYNGLDLDAENRTTQANNRRAATEELLAHATDEQLGSRLWTRLVNLVTEWLRRMGFRIQMTGYEIRDVLQRAKMYVQDGEFVSGTSVVEKHAVYRGTDHSQETGEPTFSRRTDDPDLEEARQRAGLGGRRRPIAEWIKSLQAISHAKARDFTREMGHAIAQGAFDRFHGIKRIEQNTVGNIPAEQSAYVASRLSTGIATTMRAILHHGTPQWRDGVLSKIEDSKGLLEILEPVRGDIDTFLGWMVARRAERLYAEGRENLFEPRHIEALRRAGEASPQFDQFESVAAELDTFKKAVLDVAEQAGLIDPEARAAWDQADYIPFYRIADDSPSASGPSRRRALSGQNSGIRTLRGGVDRLNDPLENLIMNFTHLMDASMKNQAILRLRDNVNGFQGILEEVGPDFKSEMIPMDQVRAQIIRSGGDPSVIPDEAMQGLAKMWAMKPPADDDVIRVMDKGKARYYRVLDPMLLKSLTAVHDAGLQGLPLDFMRWTKRLLTRGVTADPAFMIRNYIRDMMHAWTISDDKFRLGIDSLRGASKTIRETGGTIDMMFAGGSFLGGYVNATDPREVARATRQALRQKGYTAASANAFLSTVIDSPLKAWEFYTRFGDSIENASREAVYEAAMREGRSRAEAVFMAKDLMDYSMRGSNSAVQFLTDVVPFLNARLQGLYKLGRAGVNNPGPIFARGSLIMLATLALLYDNKDDERYEQLEDWDKDTYWHFFPPEGLPGMPAHIRIPKPFEVGVLFGTLPERIAMNALDKEDSRKTYERMLWSLNSTFAFNPVPQAMFPPMEVFANRNIFTGAPIENLADQNRLPEARYSPYTSETMQALGQVTGPIAGLSPKELQHLWRGYTGTLGMYALGAADMISRRLQDKPPRPAMRVDRMPVVGSFIRAEPANRTQFQTDLYDLFNEARQIQRTVDAYVEEGNVDKAMQLADENPKMMAALPSMRDTTRDLGKIRDEITMIYQSEDMTPEEKREAIDELISVRNDITRSQVKALQDFFAEDPLKEEQ